MGTIKPTIFLVKEDVKDIKKLFTKRLQSKEVEEGIIFFQRSSTKKPEWADFVLENFELDSNPFKNSSSYAAIIVPVEDRIFIIPLGMGIHLLDQTKIHYNFGLRTALNAIPKNEIRQLDTTKPELKSQKTKRLAAVGTTPENFEINKDKEILRGIVGKLPEKLDLGSSFEGKDSLRANISLGSLKDLKSYLKKIYKLYQKDTYKVHYPWIDNISLVRDKKVEEELLKLLTKELRSGKLTDVYIIPPIFFSEDSEITGFKFSTGDGTRLEKKELFEMPSIQDWKGSIATERKNITAETVINFKIHEIRTDRVGRSWPLIRALAFETMLNGTKYILSEGSWYEISIDFYTLINDYFNSKVIDVSKLLPSPTKNPIKESEYNKEICKALKGRFLFDLGHKDAKLKSIGKDGNEVCDVYDTTTNTFIHVKMGKSSSSLSHLFQQGNFSGIALKQEEKLLDQFLGYLAHDGFASTATMKPLQPHLYNILFLAVVGKGKKHDIPFFSKVTFYNVTSKSLEYAGYNTKFAYVCLP